jgi:hypothetical protein
MFYIKIQLLDSFSFVLRWAICAELYEIVCEFATNNTLKDFIVNLFFFSEEEVSLYFWIQKGKVVHYLILGKLLQFCRIKLN